MPNLNTKLHLEMFNHFKKENKLIPRFFKALKREFFANRIYGLEWGDPEFVEPLRFILERYVHPYIDKGKLALEIGPGGGRWTRYLLDFKKIFVVDFHAEILLELKKNFNEPNMVFIKNNGTDFPNIEEGSIDYIFSFGTFVHLDTNIIEEYLQNINSIITPTANIVLQYSDKTKIMAQENEGFSENTPFRMREMVLASGYKILEEDLTTLWHSSIIRFGK